jgi:hypothetical protein
MSDNIDEFNIEHYIEYVGGDDTTIKDEYGVVSGVSGGANSTDNTPVVAIEEAAGMTTVDGSESTPADLSNHILKTTGLVKDTITECSLVSGRDGVREPCSSDEAVKIMRDILGSEARNGMSKREILELVKKKLSVKDERSVIMSSEFVQRAGRERAVRELKRNFKNRGPTDSKLLSNFDIDDIMQQWAMTHPDFFAYNFNMRDWESHGDTLATIDVADLYREGYRTAACVINSDVYSGKGKHWMALFMDTRNPEKWTVEFFNSSGNPPVVEFCNWMIRAKHHLRDAAREAGLNPTIDIVRASTICHQKSKSECGVYSLYYIFARLNGIPWTYFGQHPISDAVMFEFRQHLFMNPNEPRRDRFDWQEFQKRVKILWE